MSRGWRTLVGSCLRLLSCSLVIVHGHLVYNLGSPLREFYTLLPEYKLLQPTAKTGSIKWTLTRVLFTASSLPGHGVEILGLGPRLFLALLGWLEGKADSAMQILLPVYAESALRTSSNFCSVRHRLHSSISSGRPRPLYHLGDSAWECWMA